MQVSEREAAGFFGVSLRRMREILATDLKAKAAWEEGQQQGRISLRRKQLALAEKNASMAIFLGKQYLDQNEVVVNEHSGRDGGPILTQSIDLKRLDINERKRLRALIGRARKE